MLNFFPPTKSLKFQSISSPFGQVTWSSPFPAPSLAGVGHLTWARHTMPHSLSCLGTETLASSSCWGSPQKGLKRDCHPPTRFSLEPLPHCCLSVYPRHQNSPNKLLISKQSVSVCSGATLPIAKPNTNLCSLLDCHFPSRLERFLHLSEQQLSRWSGINHKRT